MFDMRLLTKNDPLQTAKLLVKGYSNNLPPEIGGDPCPIENYLHCLGCLEYLKKYDYPMAPRDYARLNVGLIDKNTLQIWCIRHEREVARFPIKDTEGLKHWDEPCHRCGDPLDGHDDQCGVR